MRSSARSALVIALGLGLSGCAGLNKFVKIPGMGQPTEWSKVVPAHYQGKECGQVLYDLSKYRSYSDKLPKAKDKSLDKQVFLSVCPRSFKVGRIGHTIEQTGKIEQFQPEDLHKQFDDRHPGELKKALLVFWTAFPYGFNGKCNFDSKDRYQRTSDLMVGTAKFYANRVDEAKLYKEMQAAGVPKKAQDIFLKDYQAAVARLDGRIAQMPEAEKILYTDVPAEVSKQRAEHFAKYPEMYAEYDKLVAQADAARKSGGDTEEIIGKLEDLRTRYLAKCGKLQCQYDPLYAGTSNQLGMLYAAKGDKFDAYMVSRPFTGQGKYTVSFAQAVRAARIHRGTQFYANRQKYRRAVRGGMDKKTAANMAGGPMLAYSPRRDLFNVKASIPDYSRAIRANGRIGHFSAKVQRIRKAKDGLRKIYFKKYTDTYQQAYHCKRTHRVERILRDGTLVYEEHCRYRKKTVTRESHKPVMARADELKAVKRGDTLAVYTFSDGPVRVDKVYRDKKIVQVGAVPVEPVAPPKRARR